MITLARRIGLTTSASAISLLVSASTVYGQFAGPDPNIIGTPDPGNDPETVRAIILRIVTAVLNFLALIAVIVVIIAGIRLIVSQGEEEEKDKAKKTIIYALAGLAVVLFSRVIVGLITNYLAGEVQ